MDTKKNAKCQLCFTNVSTLQVFQGDFSCQQQTNKHKQNNCSNSKIPTVDVLG